MKKYKILSLIILMVTFFSSAPKVNALDYYFPNKWAGKSPGDTFSINSGSTVQGAFHYETNADSHGDYLLLSYCASGTVSTWVSGATHVPTDGIPIDTKEWCSTGSKSGTKYLYYYAVNEWIYSEDGSRVYVDENTSVFYNSSSSSVDVKFFGISDSTTLDMSYAILAYLKSQEQNIDYTDALTQIQENQAQYQKDIGIIQDKLGETNTTINDMKDALTSDSVTDDTGSSFFDNFTVTDNGGISSIVTAPLVAINNMIEGTCSPMTATYRGKTISLPCGDTFWADMPDVRKFLNVVLGGFLCYGILAKLYLLIDRLKNPEDDRVDVMKL